MANYDTCKKCGNPLKSDEIAIYRKMILRCADEFLCIDCLAEYLGVSRGAIEERIEFFRKSGCALF